MTSTTILINTSVSTCVNKFYCHPKSSFHALERISKKACLLDLPIREDKPKYFSKFEKLGTPKACLMTF